MGGATCHIENMGRKQVHLRTQTGPVDSHDTRSVEVSFENGPTLREQYWWTWGNSLAFVLLKQGEWILVVDKPTAQNNPNGSTYRGRRYLHLKDRFVDLTRITSKETES